MKKKKTKWMMKLTSDRAGIIGPPGAIHIHNPDKIPKQGLSFTHIFPNGWKYWAVAGGLVACQKPGKKPVVARWNQKKFYFRKNRLFKR